MVEWLEMLCYDVGSCQQVMSLNPGFAIRQLENLYNFESGKVKAVNGH